MDQFRKDNEALQENLEQRKLKSLADTKVTTNLSLLKSPFAQSLFLFFQSQLCSWNSRKCWHFGWPLTVGGSTLSNVVRAKKAYTDNMK